MISRPEEGNTLRNKLCRLLTSPDSSISTMAADLLFVLCKEKGNFIVYSNGWLRVQSQRHQNIFYSKIGLKKLRSCHNETEKIKNVEKSPNILERTFSFEISNKSYVISQNKVFIKCPWFFIMNCGNFPSCIQHKQPLIMCYKY